MNLFGLTITRTKAVPVSASPVSTWRGWWPIVHEPYTGAWQRNEELRLDTSLSYAAVFACVTLIASDIAKCALRLVEKSDDGIWSEVVSNSPFWPVLRKPNRYQTTQKFIEQWLVSKLVHGNAYILKERDQRGVVRAMYVLDPTRVQVLVAEDGSVWYQLSRDPLSGLKDDSAPAAPASEIIHDLMVALWHPLIGVSPIYASGLAAMQGNKIQANSYRFFNAGSQPSGIISTPNTISDAQAAALKARWDAGYSGDNVGKVAILGDGLKFERMTVTAVDAQLIDQLRWTAENVCTAFHVPPYMIGVGPPPPYANVEPLIQQYYSVCLQPQFVGIEGGLDEGLGLTAKPEGRTLGTEFDINDLIWMDTTSKTTAAASAVSGSILSINEARKRYFGVGPVEGGSTMWMQQQDTSLQALIERDRRAVEEPEPEPVAEPDDEDEVDGEFVAAFMGALHTKSIDEGLYDA